jgi:membrane protease YdiL (CAAX protease family)
MDSRYRQEVAKFGKKDGILALMVFLGYILYTLAFVAIRDMFSLPWLLLALVNIVGTSFPAGMVILIVLCKKQALSSIGLHKEKIWPAIRLGLLICLIPVLFTAIIPGIFGGFNELLIGALILNLVTTFFFAAHEDVIFVGFIQTRLYGFFKTDKVAITVGALLFALMHIPPWLVMGRIDTSNLLMGIGLPFLGWFLMHLVFTSVFKKYYSLVPVFILHTINNYSMNFAQTTTVLGIESSFIVLSLYALAAVILFWHTHRQSK